MSAFCGAACSSTSVTPKPDAVSSSERLSAAPAVGPEIGTIAPVFKPSYLGHNPELASDGVGFLSVQEVNERIRAVRVDDGGHVLDGDWLDFGTDDGSMQLYPAAAFGGGHYLVTWSNLLTDTDGNNHDSIQGRFVKSDGTLEGSANLTLSSGNAIYSSVGFDGDHFVLAYMVSTDAGMNDIHSVLLNPDGTRVESSDHALTTTGDTSNPHLAVGDSNTLVVWEDYTRTSEGFDTSPRIHGVRVDHAGAPLDDAPVALSSGIDPIGQLDETMPDVAAGSNHFLVVWQASDMTVHGSLLADGGSFVTANFRIDHGAEGAGLPSAAFQGTDFAVGWTDARDGGSVYGTPVSMSGSPAASDSKLGPDAPREVGFGSDHTNLAFDGSNLFFTYLGSDPNGIEGSLLTADLALTLGAIPLTAVPDSQAFASTSFDGTDYVVAWNDEERSSNDTPLQAVRINGSGQVLDSAGIAVSPPDKPAFGFSLASPENGSTLFIWSGTDDMPQQRTMAADATLGNVGPFVTQNGAFVPGLASDGHGYLSAFNAGNSSDTGSVYGHLLGLDGSSGSEFRIDASTLNTGPFVLATASGYLVVYSRSGTHVVSVSDAGALGQALDLSPAIAGVNGASSDTDSLLAWSDTFGSPGPLQARFVKAGAFSGDAFELTPDSLGYSPALAWDGTSYWAVWESSTHELDGRSIAEDGTLGSILSLVPAEVYTPALLSDRKGQLLLSYAKVVGEGLSYRIASRLIGRGADATGGTGAAGGAGGGAGAGTGGTSSPGSGGTSNGAGGSGSPGSGGTSTAGSGGTSTPGSGGASAPGAGGSTGGSIATGGTLNGGSGGKSGAGGSAGAAAGKSGTGGSSGGAGPGCAVAAESEGGRSSVLAALFGLAWVFVARRRRGRSLT